jgi:predicted amidophosphoribosyltransferase
MTTKDYVCADCGHDQDSMNRCCDKCRSIRMVALSFVKLHFGEDWRKKFEEKK